MQKKEKHVQNICFIKTIKNKQAKTTTNKNKEKVNKLEKLLGLCMTSCYSAFLEKQWLTQHEFTAS